MTNLLIDPDELAALVARGLAVRILDVRWQLDRPDGYPAFLEGHIPGSVYVDLNRELASSGAPEDGRHPLPHRDNLQDSARQWGINPGDLVVVYDDLGSMSAARAWWVLVDAGLEVRVLDGGLQAWVKTGRDLEYGKSVAPHGHVTLSSGHLPRLTIDEAAAMPNDGLLVDARAPERYRGEWEPIDPKAGHIPGAVNVPTSGNIDADGRFLAPNALRRRFEEAGASNAPVGVYCGSGVTAAHSFVALKLAGFSPRLYPGSWSQWSNTPGRDVVGPETLS